jgi:hypothetical protein
VDSTTTRPITTTTEFEGEVWGTDIPRVHQKDKMPHEGPVGPIIRKVIPSWAWGGTPNKADRCKAGPSQAQMAR